MKKITFVLLIILLISSCSNIEDKYTSSIKPLIKDFNKEINNLSYLYLNLENNTPDKEAFDNIQSSLYSIKLALLKINTPQKENYINYTNTFLQSIEEFELLTYKMSGLVSTYNDKTLIEQNLNHKSYTSKEKFYQQKLSIIENLIKIQKNDIKQTINDCRDNLSDLKKMSNSLIKEDVHFPEFLFKL